MKFLDRANTEKPACLDTKNYEIDEFTSLNPNQKKSIWRALNSLQGSFCAYCERTISKRNRQIEHFYPKKKSPDGINMYKHMTFCWENLFGSCITHEHCGQYKDSVGKLSPAPYSPQKLIKPDEHNPTDFFVFSEKGVISLKDDLEEQACERGEETLRVFKLNAPSLIDARASSISLFKPRFEFLLQQMSDENISLEFFHTEVKKLKATINQSAHRTAVNMALFS
ncbi:TIGR02646 family protein [Marinomonas agarivorans]|nr:TIGR02646 family protein [Marinomonas agarivorans]